MIIQNIGGRRTILKYYHQTPPPKAILWKKKIKIFLYFFLIFSQPFPAIDIFHD